MCIPVGIIGTKEYRKPEWVTHMEELQAALKGKDSSVVVANNSSLMCATSSMSVDSLEESNRKYCSEELGKSSSTSLSRSAQHSFYLSPPPTAPDNNAMNEPFYISHYQESHSDYKSNFEMPPFISMSCDQVTSSKHSNVDYLDSAMTDYLNSYRHSLSSVMELMSNVSVGSNLTECIPEVQYHETKLGADSVEHVYVEDEDVIQDDNSYYILTPIEENSEQSTESGSTPGSLSYENKQGMCCINESNIPQRISSSCDPIPSTSSITFSHAEMHEKYQTFPKSKIPVAQKNFRQQSTMYPLEPRELDPAAFHQLHTADSQEELQEFLLLESECMTDGRNRGLASAFVMSDDEHSETGSNEEEQDDLVSGRTAY